MKVATLAVVTRRAHLRKLYGQCKSARRALELRRREERRKETEKREHERDRN